MDIIRARKILEILADGINPVSGEVLPPDDCCNQGEVVRAFHTILSELKKESRHGLPANAGKPWSAEDEALLCGLFDSGKKLSEICSALKRTRGGISARLERLGKINDRNDFN